MFKPTSLLEIAVDCDEKIRNGGTTLVDGEKLYKVFFRRDQAMICAEWMEANDERELPFVGPFGKVPYHAGDKIRIKKGAMIHTTGPVNVKTAGRAYVVEASYVFDGFAHKVDGTVNVQQPTVRWAGAGGYWHWTNAENVEAV